MRIRRLLFAAATLAGAACLAPSAHADWYRHGGGPGWGPPGGGPGGGWHEPWHRGGWGGGWRGPVYGYRPFPPPIFLAPPPVFLPPRVYYGY